MKELLAKAGKEIFLYRQDMKPIWRFCAVTLAIFVVAAAVHLNWQGGLGGKTQPLDEVTTFQTLSLSTLDGGTFTAEDLADYDLIVVDIWATWCFHCVEEMPNAAQFSDSLETAFPDKKVLYMGVCTDLVDAEGNWNKELIKAAQDISANANVHYPQLIADKAFNDDFTMLYAQGLPAIFYLDGQGNILHQTGGLSGTGYALQVRNLLDAQQGGNDEK